MIKGTTPTHVFTLPFDTGSVKTVQIIYAQSGAVKLTKGNKDCTLDGNKVSVKLTQEDTFLFTFGVRVDIQVRVLTIGGDALASRVTHVLCEDCLSDEVLQ